MIERFYLKDYLSFDSVELNLRSGLIVFSGPSGSGKSILMQAILSSLGGASCEASLCESSVTWQIDAQTMGIENEEINVFKQIKKGNARYFINNQSLSKKAIAEVAAPYLRHLSLKDYSDFENANLLELLDKQVVQNAPELEKLKQDYKAHFLKYAEISKELDKLINEEQKIIELKEFLTFEIEKIKQLNPSVNEDEELMQIKKELSKKEKVTKAIENAMEIFKSEHLVSSALELLSIESAFFDDAMNELRAHFDTAQEHFEMLNEVDIDEVFNRIEAISTLKRRYGTIEDALMYKEQKELELQKYENIESTKEQLQTQCTQLQKEMQILAQKISSLRLGGVSQFGVRLNAYLKNLYLRNATLSLDETEATELGIDKLTISLGDVALSKISTGEFNRLRLAVLALKAEYMERNGGILMLDEIDANLSGEESMSVAKVLRQLAQHFQIFVVSHQPQLTSMGDQHFLVYKENSRSCVKELSLNEKIDEIARIISGEAISQEAKKFAQELLEAKK